jgi:flavin reductase (DIM6/NTAB) family NADH-FMN oxidoreductase RutF
VFASKVLSIVDQRCAKRGPIGSVACSRDIAVLTAYPDGGQWPIRPRGHLVGATPAPLSDYICMGGVQMKKSLGAQTLSLPIPTWVVGTYDAEGRPNAMTAAWGGICCSDPPCVAVSLRSATYTHGNMKARKAFTISVPSQSHVKEADYFGLVGGRDTDKFSATGLTPVRSELVDAPYIQECPLILECTVAHVFELGLHTQFVGEIKDVKADEAVLAATGHPDIEQVRPIIFSPGCHIYHGVGPALGQAFEIGKEIGGG